MVHMPLLFPHLRPLPLPEVKIASRRFCVAGPWICFSTWRAVCRNGSGVSFMSKLEHSVAPHCKWVLMTFPAFIFCTVRQPYGSTEMSAAPAGANILQPPWWHCHQSFTYTQVIACSRHIYICVRARALVCVCVCVCVCETACCLH